MEVYLIIGSYVLCSLAAWFIWADWWRQDLDIDLDDAIFAGLCSLAGPAFLIVAIMLWIGKAVSKRLEGKGPVWRRK